MEKQVSDYGKINTREGIKGLALFVLSSVLVVVWQSLSTVVEIFISTYKIDFSSFGESISLSIIVEVGFAAALSYLGLTKYGGKKVK